MVSGYSGIQAGDMFFMARNSSQEFKSLKSKPRLMKALQGRGSVSLKACDFLSGVSIGGLPLSSHGFEL